MHIPVRNFKNKKEIYRYFPDMMAMVTGPMLLILHYFFTSPGDYVIGDGSRLEELLFLSFFTVVTLGIFFYGWYKFYRQFKKDKEKMGFRPEKSGGELLVEIIIVAIAATIPFIFF